MRRHSRLAALGAAAATAVLPSAAGAHELHSSSRAVQTAAVTAPCPSTAPSRSITPDHVITGEFDTTLRKSYVMLPFDVPEGTTAVRVKYCYDRPEASPPTGGSSHTLDLGLYGPRSDPARPWGVGEFRGWGGSSHPDVTVSAEGFAPLADPRVEVPGKTTRAFLPGRIVPGQWAVELGAGAVIGQPEDTDGKVAWRVEIELADDEEYTDEGYVPAPYDRRPVRGAGWYAGDMHVHAEHSAYRDASMSEAFGYAFRPIAQGGAGLDFITLSDYVSGSAWGEIGRYQPSFPRHLIARSAEVITYRGHANNHISAKVVDYREGRIYEWRDRGADSRPDSGRLPVLRGTRDPSALFDDIHRGGGFTQVNHPTIFPPTTPGFAALCRGCFWEYSDAETQWPKVDGYEVATGPAGFNGVGPNPFTVTAIREYDRILGLGAKIAAVGVSDSHNAGRTPGGITQAPIGTATTVVRAPNLSEAGIACGIRARNTYVKVTGNAGPDVRFEAIPRGGAARAVMGDTVRASSAAFTARVTRGSGRQLTVYRNGSALATVPVTSGDFTYRFSATGTGRYRLQVQRGSTIETVTTPIWLAPGRGSVDRRPCEAAQPGPLPVGAARGAGRARGIPVGPGRHRTYRVRRGRFRVRCRAHGRGRRVCAARVVRGRGSDARTLAYGRAFFRGRSVLIRMRLNRLGRQLLRRHPRGMRAFLILRVRDAQGRFGQSRTRVRLRARPRRR